MVLLTAGFADFEKTFIQCIVYNYEMLKEYKDEASLKAAGKVMTKGKDYGKHNSMESRSCLIRLRSTCLHLVLVVADGDIILSTQIFCLTYLSQWLTHLQSKPVLRSHDRTIPIARRKS